MAYSDDISGLGADHHWAFDGDALDGIGSANGTNTGCLFTGSAIAEDATNCMTTNGVGDRISIPTTTTINNSAQARKAVAGWFEFSAINQPFTRIYGEGNNTTNFQIVAGFGNVLTLEVRDGATWQVQIYTDRPLVANRAYHVAAILEGSAYGNEVRFYLDGVEQTNAIPADRQPDDASLASRGVAEFGDPAGTVGLDGTALLMVAPVNGLYQHWCAWGDEADAVLTETEVRETLFERGALADVTISSGTESAMQTALDAYADTVRGDAPVCIEVEAVSGGGDFSLDLDNITFNSKASCHVRYNGTADTLTIRNTNGSDCSIVSAPFGGSIELRTEVSVKVTAKDASTGSVITGARVLLEADTGGPLTAGTDIISTTTDGSGEAEVTFDFESDQPVTGRVRKGSSSVYYQTASLGGSITGDGYNVNALMVRDE
jgi:hypothetical protein